VHDLEKLLSASGEAGKKRVVVLGHNPEIPEHPLGLTKQRPGAFEFIL